MTRNVVIAALVACFAVLGSTSSAQAQPWDDRPNLLPPTPHGIWGEMAMYGRGDDPPDDPGATVFSTLLHGYFGIARRFELAFSWGFGYQDLAEDEWVAGNPYLGARYVWVDRQHRFRIGGGMTIPVARPDLGGLPQANVRGWWSSWLWLRNRLTFVAPELRWEFHARVFYMAAEAALAFLIYTGDGDDDAEVASQVGLELGARLAERFILGMRFQVAGILTADGDNAQVAMAPFFQAEFGQAFLFFRFLMNLDRPLGFAFDDRGWWAFQFGGGARF